MPKYYQLPNGAYYEAPDELSPGEAYKKAFRDYPEAFGGPTQKGPESGFLPAAKAGISSLTSDITALAGRTGLMDEAAAEKKIQAEEEYRKRIFKPTQTWGEAPLTKGLELLGGSLPYMAAPLAAGVVGAATPIAGAGAAAAGLASLGQFTGSNLSRQIDEGVRLGQTELGSAAAAAVPQAALDLLSFKLAPGIRQIFAAVGKEVPEQVAEQIAKQGTMRTLRDYGVATGKAMGAEGITEAGQQFFERLQAGLNLTDAKARDEYWDSLVGGAVLGGALAPAGRYLERGQIAQRQAQEQRALEAKKAAEEAKLAAAEAEQLKAYRQTPEYLTDIQQRYADLVKQEQELAAKTKIKPEGTDPASMKIAEEEKRAARKELADFKSSDDYQKTLAEFIEAKPLLKQIEQKRKATEAVFGQQDLYTPEDTSPAAQALSLQAQIADLQKQQAKKGLTLAEQQPFQNRINALEEQLYGKEGKEGMVPSMPEYTEARRQLDAMIKRAGEGLTAATTTADLQRNTDNLQRLEKAKADLEKLRTLIKAPTAVPSLSQLRDQVDAAQQKGDTQALQRLVPMLAEAEKQGELPFATGYESENQLAAEIAQGREDATRRREVVEAETNALLRIGQRPLTPFALGRREATLREARETLRAATKPTGRTVSKGVAYQVVDGKLGAATEVSKIVRRNEQDWDAFGKDLQEREFRTVGERERFRQELKDKLKELEADYSQFTEPSPALQRLHQTYTNAIKQTLADVEKKLALTSQAKGDVDSMIMTASDERVADLIDRLLGPATERAAEEKAQRPLEGMQPSLFDVEAQKKIATGALETRLPQKAESQARGELPIEQAQRLMEEGQSLRALIKDYSDKIQRAGRPTKPEKIAELADLKKLRDDAKDLLEITQNQYERLVQMQTPAYAAEEAAPTTADLFGGLEEARSEQNRIQDSLDRLYEERDTLRSDLQRRGQMGATPQLQALVDQYSKDTPRLRQVEDEIAKQEAELQRVSGKNSARFDEFIQAREAERGEAAPSELAQLQQELRKLRDALPYVEQVGDDKAVRQIKDAIQRAEQRVEYEQYRLETGKGAAPKEKTTTLPGFERRAGVRPVDEQQLRDARTELVALQNTGEELRKVQTSQDKNPTRYLRQLAIQKNEQYEAFLTQSDDPITQTWPLEKLTLMKRKYPKRIDPTQRDVEYFDALRKQIKYFENVMRGGTRRSLDQAVQDNLDKQDQARARIAELESRQRAYEQQEAVRTGAAPGEAEAQRLIEGAGYRTPSGATRKAPKKLASWGITAITKKNATPVAPAKVAATSNVLRQYQKETEEATAAGALKQESLQKKLAKATKNLENLNNVLNQVYPESVATATEEEITNLLAAGMTPEQLANMRDMGKVYNNLKNSVAGNTVADVIARLEVEKERLSGQLGRFTGRRGSVAEEKENKKVSQTIQEQLQDLTKTIRDLSAQPKSKDPWTAAFNALIQETNTRALITSQNVGYESLALQGAKDRLAAFEKAAQDALVAVDAEPDSPSKAMRLANAREKLDRITRRLPINDNAYNATLDAYNKAVDEFDGYQAAYQTARIEQLSLLQAYGNDVKKAIDTEVANIQKLTPELEQQAKDNADRAAELKKANQALAKAKIEERKKAAEKVPSQTAGLTYSAQEREALQRIRQGLGLPGTRYETDTTSALVTKTKAAIRQTLTLEQAKLDKLQAPIETAKQRLAEVKDEQAAAKRNGDWKEADRQQVRIDSMQDALEKSQAENAAAVREQTLKVQELQNAFESVQGLGERVVTPVGEGAEERVVEREESGVLPGTRLPRRRVGPVARVGTQPPGQMLSGTPESREAISKGNRPMQAGTQRLTAADMNQADASAISLAVMQQQLDAATGNRKTELEAAFKAATNGMTEAQIDAKIDRGNELINQPGAVNVVAAREKVRAANEKLKAAEADRRAATTPAGKEIAQDSVDMAQEELDRAYAKLEAAQNEVAVGIEPDVTPKNAVQNTFDEALEAELGELRKAGVGKDRTTQIGEDLYGEDVAMEYTTATRTESNAATQEAIKDGRFMEAVERLAVDSDNPLIRETANDIRRLLMRTKVVIDPELTVNGKPVPAAYDPATNTVKFRSEAITDEDIIHEAVHAVTLQVLRTPDGKLTPQQRNAKRELMAIYKKAAERGDLRREYGITDVEEFVSEMQSNSEFRAAVDKQPWYKRFWHALTRLWSNKPIEKISDQASDLIKQLYLPSTNVLEGKQVASIFRRAAPVQSSLVATDQPGKMATLRGNLFGLTGRVQYIDRLAAADEGIVAAEGAGKLSSTEAFNAQYFMRMSDKVTQAAGQFITSGPVRIVADKRSTGVEYRYESTDGPSLLGMSQHLELGAKAANMSPQEAEVMLTTLIAGQRANSLVNGWERLQSDNPAAAKAEYTAAQARMRANPKLAEAMEAAMQEYKAYNEGLLNFAAQCGYLSKDEVARLNKLPYVPFYRVEDGKVQLNVLGERPITIGNLKDSPDLQQFLGDNKKIMPILTSAVQNTFMLTRASMHNKSTMETSNALFKAGFVSKMGKGPGLANPSTVHYKIDGADHFATIDADTFGIPAELIVRGMEGIKTIVPDVVKMMGIPASILRKFITRSPAYVVRQLIREPVNAFIVSGVDGVPIANALKQMANMRAGRSPEELALMRGLVVSSNIYTGDEADMQKFLNDVAAGRSGWDKFLGKLDTMALQADSATRAIIYQDSIKKGFSEAQAQFRAMESQNFGRRGLSPSMQIMNTLVPFFNAQIQGLDVLYRSFRGRMPYAEQLEIQRKIVARGALLFAGSLAYAAMMQDDEDYKKAKPEERYANFFVHIPGVKDPLKLPVPFEVGLLFMGLPQALMDVAAGDTKAKEAIKAMGKLLLNSAPSVIPAAPKPILEAFYGQTQFGPIESEREKKLEAEVRFRPQTTELAKTLGGFTGAVGISPLMLEHFVRGYTGGLGVALMSTLNPLLRSGEEGAKVPLGAAKQPFIGGLFQTSEGRFFIDRAYERMEDIVQAQQTYKDYIKRGMPDRAAAYAKEHSELLMSEKMAGKFRQKMGELFEQERAIAANPRLSEAEKERQIDQLKQLENTYAKSFYSITDRTTPR
jgi:Large polyvalent protein associated domain 38